MATIYKDLSDALLGRFIAQWGSRTEYALPGQEYNPEPGTDWVRVSYSFESDEREAFTGTPSLGHAIRGTLTAQIFTTMGLDDKAIFANIDAFRDAFHNVVLSVGDYEVFCFPDGVDGPFEDPPWLQYNGNVAFRVLEVA